MTFDLCVPAYNEASIIKETVERIRAALTNAKVPHWNIIVADNASTDGTGDRIRALRYRGIETMYIEEKGKGNAIIACARVSEADYFGFIDADLSASPVELAPMLAILAAEEADLVIGSRLMDTDTVKRGILRTLSSRVFNILRSYLIGGSVQDSQCGLKVMNEKGRNVLRVCEERGWFLDMELLVRAEHAGLRIREVPIYWNEHQYSGRESKLRLVRDGIGSVLAMMRIRARLDQK